MKILFFEWNSFGNEDIKKAFSALEHEIVSIPFSMEQVNHDEKLEEHIKTVIDENNIDAAFSFNYYPPIAYACNDMKKPYIAWVYDSPYVMLYSFTVVFDTNYIFVFDKELYDEFIRNRITTVYYMPLAANPISRSILLEDSQMRQRFENSKWKNETDIAFVGSLYNEEHCFFDRLKDISEYTRGYLEAIIATQKQVWGYNFIQSMMTDNIMDDMSKNLPMKPDKFSVASRQYLFGEYVINREITARERHEYLMEIADKFSCNGLGCIDLYTPDKTVEMKGIINHGPIDPYTVAPFVFNTAKININITLRSIHSGIPLRAFEILAAGGFLLTNYQNDYADCYVEGEDYISYDSKEDMLNKIEYFLSHEKERKEISENGYNKTVLSNTFEHRLKLMLAYIENREGA